MLEKKIYPAFGNRHERSKEYRPWKEVKQVMKAKMVNQM